MLLLVQQSMVPKLAGVHFWTFPSAREDTHPPTASATSHNPVAQRVAAAMRAALGLTWRALLLSPPPCRLAACTAAAAV